MLNLMMAECYQQTAKLFQAAQDLEPERRNDYLNEACKGNEELFRE